MKLLAIAALALAPLAFADEAADRTAIGKLLAALNDRNAPHDQLYTADSGDSRQLLERIERIPDSGRPMSEVTPPVLVLSAVRFITPEVALVDAAITQYGSLAIRERTPVLLILRKSRDWQVAVVRVQANPYPVLGNFLVRR